MGRPYKNELEKPSLTYNWALTADITEIMNFQAKSRYLPLTSVGSGGSFTAAIFSDLLHQQFGMSTQYLTPFEFITSNTDWRNRSLMLFTAKGGNSDINASIKTAIQNEIRQLLVMCTKKGSKIYPNLKKDMYAPDKKGQRVLIKNVLLEVEKQEFEKILRKSTISFDK